jgi:hypothetical protein
VGGGCERRKFHLPVLLCFVLSPTVLVFTVFSAVAVNMLMLHQIWTCDKLLTLPLFLSPFFFVRVAEAKRQRQVGKNLFILRDVGVSNATVYLDWPKYGENDLLVEHPLFGSSNFRLYSLINFTSRMGFLGSHSYFRPYRPSLYLVSHSTGSQRRWVPLPSLFCQSTYFNLIPGLMVC